MKNTDEVVIDGITWTRRMAEDDGRIPCPHGEKWPRLGPGCNECRKDDRKQSKVKMGK